MFDYSIKTKVIFILSLVVLIVALIFLTNYNNSRSKDLEIIRQAKNLAISMERYFDKNYAYPEFSKIKLDGVQAVTENGLNQEGDYLYFRSEGWAKDGSIVSTKERYIIEFELDNSWETWEVNSGSGAFCRISNYLEMICQSK